MADNIVEQNPLSPPLEPGVDHPNSGQEIINTVANLTGQTSDETTPAAAKQALAQSNVNQFLDIMGAKKPEEAIKQQSPPSGLEQVGENLDAYNPFSDTTDRTGDDKVPLDLGAERKRRMEEKKAA